MSDLMRPVRFGNTGLRVSQMCLGTMMFGGATSLHDAKIIADMALERGVFFWDTADMYSLGASEEVCGKLLKGRRHDVVLATKVFATMSSNPNDRGLSARHILQACDESLRRLQTDWIDLYYLHFPEDTPLDETLRAMEDLCRSGKVRYIGCSNYRAWEVVGLINKANEHNWQPICAVQPLYNIANRDIEVEMLPMTKQYGLGVASYSPLARGVLTGKYSAGKVPQSSRLDRKDKRFLQAEWRSETVALAEKLQNLSARLGCTLSQLATRWAMANQNIHSVIIGPRTIEQMQDALETFDVTWDEEAEAFVDSLIPPGCHSGKAFFDTHYSPVLGRRPLFP